MLLELGAPTPLPPDLGLRPTSARIPALPWFLDLGQTLLQTSFGWIDFLLCGISKPSGAPQIWLIAAREPGRGERALQRWQGIPSRRKEREGGRLALLLRRTWFYPFCSLFFLRRHLLLPFGERIPQFYYEGRKEHESGGFFVLLQPGRSALFYRWEDWDVEMFINSPWAQI